MSDVRGSAGSFTAAASPVTTETASHVTQAWHVAGAIGDKLILKWKIDTMVKAELKVSERTTRLVPMGRSPVSLSGMEHQEEAQDKFGKAIDLHVGPEGQVEPGS